MYHGKDLSSGTAAPLSRSSVVAGCLLWLAFSFVSVWVRGVRWDENYEFAQALLGIIPYPEGHPLYQHVHNAFSLQTYLVAAAMHVLPGPLVANGLRNVLFVAVTTIPVYLFGARLSGKSAWGHAAALLVMMRIHAGFFSTYPIEVWPVMGSNGAIGQGFALLTLYLLAAGRLLPAFLLVGLMPAVHIGQFPPLAVVAALCLVERWRNGPRKDVRRVLLGATIGLALTAICGGIFLCLRVEPPTSGPYFSTIPAEVVWQGHLKGFASHRDLPFGTGHITIVCMLLLSVAGIGLERAQGVRGGPWLWVGTYGVAVAALVWGIMAVHLILGERTPYSLLSWMPYRLMNHLGPLAIAMMIALLATERASGAGIVVILVLLVGAVRPWIEPVLGHTLYTRYLSGGEGIFLGLFGAAAAIAFRDLGEHRRFRRVWAVLLAVSWVALLTKHQFGAACAAAGWFAALALASRVKTIWMARTLVPACALLMVAILIDQATHRQHLPVSDFERRVRAYLDEQGEPTAMIAVRHEQYEGQARLGHPVTTDMATLTWIPYHLSLGPSLHKLYLDLYGINIAPAASEPVSTVPWFEVWPKRELGEWQRLAVEYDFHYVLAPAFMAIQLPLIMEGDGHKLYRIPD